MERRKASDVPGKVDAPSGGWGEALAGKNSTDTFLSMEHKPEEVMQFHMNMLMGQGTIARSLFYIYMFVDIFYFLNTFLVCNVVLKYCLK